MALLIRTFIIETLNDWDETALHDHLRANPSLRRGLGFETLPDQSTFSRLLADIRREEAIEERKQNAKDGEVDTAETVIFETNHPTDTRHFPVTARLVSGGTILRHFISYCNDKIMR